ncbi:COG2426 family protein [Terrisporobacter sp.]
MEYLKLFFLSMVPIIELRGAIPLGIAMDLNPIYVYITCVIGSSIISIPVVLVFRQVIDFLRRRIYFNKLIRWVDRKIEGRAKKLKAASILGLIVFVGVPLPTTGSWSGSALASIFKMRIIDSLLGIVIGNAIAGALMLTVSMGVSGGIGIELALVGLVAVALGFYILKKKK